MPYRRPHARRGESFQGQAELGELFQREVGIGAVRLGEVRIDAFDREPFPRREPARESLGLAGGSATRRAST
jgi:hypothetical protein